MYGYGYMYINAYIKSSFNIIIICTQNIHISVSSSVRECESVQRQSEEE